MIGGRSGPRIVDGPCWQWSRGPRGPPRGDAGRGGRSGDEARDGDPDRCAGRGAGLRHDKCARPPTRTPTRVTRRRAGCSRSIRPTRSGTRSRHCIGQLIVDVNSFPDPSAIGYLACCSCSPTMASVDLDLVDATRSPPRSSSLAVAGQIYYAMTGSLPETPRGGPARDHCARTVHLGVDRRRWRGLRPTDQGRDDLRDARLLDPGHRGSSSLLVDRRSASTRSRSASASPSEASPCDGLTAWQLTIHGETSFFNRDRSMSPSMSSRVRRSALATWSRRPSRHGRRRTSQGRRRRPHRAGQRCVRGRDPAGGWRPDPRGRHGGCELVDLATDPQVCPSSPFPPSEHTVWYVVTPSVDGWVEVNTIGSDFDTTCTSSRVTLLSPATTKRHFPTVMGQVRGVRRVCRNWS